MINVADRDSGLAALSACLRAGQGFTVATLNLDHVVKLRRDPAFRTAYARHSHVTADGNPIVWLSRLSGQPVALVPGSELIEPLAAIAAREGTAIGLLGSTDAALERAAARLESLHPGLRVVARIAPPMGFDPAGETADAAIAELKAAGVQLCFVALGAPKQEIFAVHAARQMPGTGFVSIGAGLDFLAGTQTRAPALVRRVAAEWLWRLAGDPRRLGQRYAACFAILPGLVLEALASRRPANGKGEA